MARACLQAYLDRVEAVERSRFARFLTWIPGECLLLFFSQFLINGLPTPEIEDWPLTCMYMYVLVCTCTSMYIMYMYYR